MTDWSCVYRTASAPSFYNASVSISTTATGQVAHGAWCTFTFFAVSSFSTSQNTNLLCRSFLKNTLPSFAKSNPQIEIRVSPRPHKHPIVKGHYINGREKVICVRNLEPEQIFNKTNLLKEASGEKLKRTNKPVTSLNESVRGIWSPYHGDLKRV